MNELYPALEPFHQEMLQVSELHSIYTEVSGNPNGKAVVFLHGGPGGGSKGDYRRYFDPKKWKIILFDQRGCGKSLPFAELRENTTWDLVSDLEKIRLHYKIDKWSVFGGSWGSTLALSYASLHPDKITALFLRGIFMLRKKEIDWFYQEGASKIFPDAWQSYLSPIPHDKRDNLVSAYHEQLTHEDSSVRHKAARAWAMWEASTSKLIQDPSLIENFGEDQFSLAFARIECHYFINKGFFKEEDYLLKSVDKFRHIPAVIVQGRYDVVCPAESAYELHQAWPEAELTIVPDAGHSLSEKGITHSLLEATNRF